ncbi:MAG: ABC transporter ATP-binding protein/permease [Actinomycetota bacterium]|nr:ABC transporter ATP-binding protein/permease [Actinomycetota bacterium]
MGLVNLLQATGTLLIVIAFLVIALVISPPMTAFTLGFGVLAAVAYRRAYGRASSHATELTAITDELSRETTKVFGSFKYVRASGLAEDARRRMAVLVERFRDRSVKATVPQTVVRLFYEAGGVAFVGGFLVFSLLGTSEAIGTSLVFLAVFYRLAPRVTAINDALYLSRILLPWYESWRSVHATACATAETAHGTVRLPSFDVMSATDLTFSYRTGARVLTNVSVELRRGTCTAIVGESGSGKTTLMDLLNGLLEPESGQVSVDDVPLGDIDRGWWHGGLGLVMQGSTMVSGTVSENIAIGDQDPDRARVLRCLSMAAAERFVLAMPAGIDSEVGERGAKLSGGQRQRLALARALYRDPGLLCLDEATAALDSESESLILNAVEQIKRDRAVLIVSHRVRTLSIADQSVVLEDGRVAEVGSWEELTTTPTRFRRLVESQS